MLRGSPNPALGPPLRTLRGVALPLLPLLATLGSICLGLASVTESAAVGAGGTLLAVCARGGFRWRLVRDALAQTMGACGMVTLLVLGTDALVGVYNLLGGIDSLKAHLGSLPFPPLGVILLLVLDFFMDWDAILPLTAPVFVPTIVALGYDPVWFGVLFDMAMQIAYLTPPFAPACFYLKSGAPPGISLDEIFAAMWPFIGLETAEALFRACDANGMVPLVRAPGLDPRWIGRALDAGAAAVRVPGIGSAVGAAAAVAATRFVPSGTRGACPCIRAGGHLVRDCRGFEAAEAAKGAIALVETRAGLVHIEAICATPGLLVLLIGPFDLSVSLGLRIFLATADKIMLTSAAAKCRAMLV
ncbi:aldolase/citrate lyase family protein [Paracraurococcus ruber]|uniref:TRAP C4-dicarboxylate transport system permease DctM subunit domain-containing protein n=1 Tax=Paracraurococcus ruber TaxID=77675 RepID=A0ABS1D067_9PROT|nr:aldolase/citrate lyase family protein [Paracraurococcus ruber]MBK1659871.1 hypothetical protein [Paracraurococcus ruber]TDG28181.1 TRAP transporter large permease subunit [Paracraurococcus ruber]